MKEIVFRRGDKVLARARIAKTIAEYGASSDMLFIRRKKMVMTVVSTAGCGGVVASARRGDDWLWHKDDLKLVKPRKAAKK